MKKEVDKTNATYILGKNTMYFSCWYQQNEQLGRNQSWSGSVVREYDLKKSTEIKSNVSDVEGCISEYNTNLVNGLRLPESRYLFGIDGINQTDDTISFTIYPKYGKPMDYMFKYDREDNMFYGVWFIINQRDKTSDYGGFAKLELSSNHDSKKEDISSHLWELQAYYKNMDAITYMIDNKVPTLLPHEEVDESTYQNAKKYFKNNAKTLQLFYEQGE